MVLRLCSLALRQPPDIKSDNVFISLNESGQIQRSVVGDFDTSIRLKSIDSVASDVIGTRRGDGSSCKYHGGNCGILLLVYRNSILHCPRGIECSPQWRLRLQGGWYVGDVARLLA